MNGEIPSVPIITLSGVSSLTNVLLELPLPNALPHTVANRSLLYHPRLVPEVQHVLSTRNDALVQQLCTALAKSNTSHIELNDGLSTGIVDVDGPPLLRSILSYNASVFHSSYGSSGYGYGSSQPGAVYPTSVRPADELMGYQSMPNGSFGMPEHGIGYSQMQSHGSADFIYSMNGVSQMQQPHGKMAAMGVTSKAPQTCSPAQAAAAPSILPEQLQQHCMPGAAQYSSSPYGSTMSQDMWQQSAQQRVMAEQINSEMQRPTMPDMVPTITLKRVDETMNREHKKHHRHGNDISSYNVVSSGNNQKLTLRLTKNKDESRGVKRQHSDGEDDDVNYSNHGDHVTTMAQMQEVYGEFATSLTERVKRRRNTQVTYNENDASDNEMQPASAFSNRNVDSSRSRLVQDESSSDASNASFLEASKQLKKDKSSKSQHSGRRIMDVRICLEELMDTPTFKRFNTTVDAILDVAEDLDIASIRDDDDDENDTNTESIASKSQMADLCSEAAKLKSMGVMNQLPHEKLVKTLTILQFTIRDGTKIIPAVDPEEDREDDHLWRELAFERVLTALDAALTVMYVMTSSNMPKEVFLEDVIERVVRLCKTQLVNAVFPEFDPVYRVDPRNKSGIQTNVKLKRAKAHGSKDPTVIAVYNKLTELTSLLAELVELQELTDTIVLQMSTLAVSPFFVENVSEIQLNALKLVTCVFNRYEKHRQLILEDILSSLARLPSSKKNLRSYKLNAEEHIQMVTALALQLIQCVVKLPTPSADSNQDDDGSKKKCSDMVDREVMILTSYETAMRTAHNFLAVFLAKCTSKGEDDYRPLFENFVYDLLATVNKPEWPASELILSLLGNLLVRQFSSKSVEMSLRVASLDYLGIVAARLRKDAVSSQLNESVINDIIFQMDQADSDMLDDSKRDIKPTTVDSSSRTDKLQKLLLEYLAFGAENDPSLNFVRQFYIAQWYRDCTMEAEKAAKRLTEEGKKQQPIGAAKNKRQVDSDDDEDEIVDLGDDDDGIKSSSRKVAKELDIIKDIQNKVDLKKAYLMQLTATRVRNTANFKSLSSRLDYRSALLVTRYLASNRPFSQSFDIYLTQILKVLCETAVAVRTKALKCLTAVIEADPAILARTDMQSGVHGRFLDQSTSVREAAIELVGKFILIRPELTPQYYDMLSERILDTGISVRKRVIKIFRDICIEQPEFNRIPEMCVKMIRRVNDEEGIRKLVNETFQSMWFTPVKLATKEATSGRLLQKVMNITDVVAACRESGFEWLEQLLDNLLRKEEDCREKPIEASCKQIVDCLVENVLRLEEKGAQENLGGRTTSSRLVACFSTLYLFCKVKPSLLMTHCITIQPYLDIKCNSQEDVSLLNNVTRILELAVPLMEHPSESFLAQLEEDMMKLILKHGMMIIQSCVSCLGAVVNGVTHNYKLIKDTFQKFYGIVVKIQSDLQINPRQPFNKPTLLRSLFTVGLLCKNFDLDSDDFAENKGQMQVRDRIFGSLLFFLDFPDEEVQLKALTGLGFMVTRHYEFMLHKQLRDPYHNLLTSHGAPVKMCIQVLRNLQTYLLEEEVKMMKADAEWRKVHDKEDLKELGDVQSGMASTVIQLYLKQVLEAFFHVQPHVRLSALEVVVLILRQGLVHPIQCVPYLICMGSDPDTNVRMKADQQLQEIDKKYPGFIQMKAMQGIKMACRLHELLQAARRPEHGKSGQVEPLRGVRLDDNNPTSLVSYVYTLIRGNKGQRRGLLTSILNMFDDTAKTPLSELIFMADNLAYLPYQLQDEPLFIMHQVDIIVSVSGCNLLQSFRELFYPNLKTEETVNTAVSIDLVNGTQDAFPGPSSIPGNFNIPMVNLAEDDLLNPVTDPACPPPSDPGGGYNSYSMPAPTMTATSTAVYPASATALTTTPSTAPVSRQDEDDDEDVDSLFALLPDSALEVMNDLYLTAQGCVLLLVLKQHLKETYGFTDSKIQRYSPTDSAKTFEKPVNRKNGVRFNPKQALDIVRNGGVHKYNPKSLDTEEEQRKRALIESYLDRQKHRLPTCIIAIELTFEFPPKKFKQLMNSIDPDDPDDNENTPAPGGAFANGGVGTTPQYNASRASVMVDPETGLITSVPHVDGASMGTPHHARMEGGYSMPVPYMQRHSAHHFTPNSERRRGRPSGSASLPRRKLAAGAGAAKSVSKSKKKRKRLNSDSDSDDCAGDPDWG